MHVPVKQFHALVRADKDGSVAYELLSQGIMLSGLGSAEQHIPVHTWHSMPINATLFHVSISGSMLAAKQ